MVNGTNPFTLVYAPYNTPGKIGMLTFMVFLFGVSLFLGALDGPGGIPRAGRCLEAGGTGIGCTPPEMGVRLSRPAWLPRLPGPSLDGNPVLWREWQRFKPSRFLRVAWFLYTAMGLTGFAVALTTGLPNSRMQAEVIVGMSVFQVAVGLLLLSVNASTSLAESAPRQHRRSAFHSALDAFDRDRQVVGCFPAGSARDLLARLPGRHPARNGGSWFGYILLLVLLSAYCVVIASLGLAVATWVSRLGRAVAICVTIVVGFESAGCS